MSAPKPLWLSDTAIKRPVVAIVFALLLIVFGIAAALRLPVREQPDVDPPLVSVTTVYPGASARVVDRDVTDIIEANLNGIDGIDQIVSTSRDQFSQINVEFETGRDIDAAAADVRDKTSEVRADLPDEIDPPVIAKASADAQAVMWITLRSDTLDRMALTDYAERQLVDPLAVVSGVAQVVIGGARRYAMRVWLDPVAMAEHDVTVGDVTGALRLENVELPAGRIESQARELTVRAMTKFGDPDALAAMVLREEAGAQVVLGDVARVAIGAENDRSAVFVDGTPAIGLGIVRQSGANALEVAHGVRAEIDRLQARLPNDIAMSIAYDQSVFIEGSLRQVLQTLAITALLVLTVIFLFLGSVRATLVPAITIPVSLIASFMVLALAGFSINTLTLLAFVVAIGLVVDDAIVVLENITRRHEQGEDRYKAGMLGTREVAFAVISTTAVLVAVLVPVLFMGGTIGRLFTEFAVAIGAALVFSSLTALSVGATAATRLVRAATPQDRRKGLYDWVQAGFAGLQTGYRRTLRQALAHPLLVGGLSLGLAVLMVMLFRALPAELAPREDRGVFIIPIEAPQGVTLAETVKAVRQVEDILKPHRGDGRDKPIDGTVAIVGPGREGPPQVDQALMIVRLKPWGARSQSQMALVEQLTPRITAISQARAIPVNPPTLVSDAFEKPIQFVVSAGDFDTAKALGDQLLKRARGDNRLTSVEIDLEQTAGQIQLQVDRALAARLDIDARTLAETLRVFFGGDDVTEFFLKGETYEVMVRGADQFRRTPQDLARIYVRGRDDALLPLAGFVAMTETGVSPALTRVDRRPSATISAVPAPGVALGDAVAALETAAAEILTSEASLNYRGLTKEFKESSAGLWLAFGLAVTVVVLVLAALFDSFVDPLIILLALPLALCGGLGALWLAGASFNVYSQIALLLLVGLLAKNAILVVDFANQRRRDGESVDDAIEAAAQTRFRPVLMTSIATGFGAVPLVLATGPGAEGRAVMGVVIIGGIVLATLVTLIVVPVLYRLLSPLTSPPGATARAVEDALG